MAEIAESSAERARSEKSPGAFRTIREVADELGVPQHVLRFWETKFAQIRPLKRGGGRRYYRPEDVELLRCIRSLLYTEGYTIRGVQKLLRESGGKLMVGAPGPRAAAGGGAAAAPETRADPEARLGPEETERLRAVLDDLIAIRNLLRGRV